jgi:hypothetical protein
VTTVQALRATLHTGPKQSKLPNMGMAGKANPHSLTATCSCLSQPC